MYEKIFTFPPSNVPHFTADLAGISYCDESYSITREQSDQYVFEYIVRGEGTLYHNGELYHPQQGDFYILKAGARHHYYSSKEQPWTKLWLNCHGNLVGHLLSDYGLHQTVLVRDVHDGSIMQEILSSAAGSSPDRHQEIAVLLHRLVIQLHTACSTEPLIKNEQVLLLKNYIENHVEEPIRIKKLAQLVYLSPSRTIRVFKEAFGCTPYDYALTVKLSAAKLLLENTTLSIKEIAQRVGFHDAHYFSNYFKSVTGVAPKYYRIKKTNA